MVLFRQSKTCVYLHVVRKAWIEMELEKKTCTFSYADVSPSELFHNTGSTHLSFVLTNFIQIEKPSLNQIRQFKDTRGLDRRSKTMDYLIDQIETNKIMLISVGYCTHKDVAFENGKDFLLHYKLIEKYENNDQRVIINNCNTSVGQLISLAWYSVMLSVFAKQVGSFVRFEKKDQGMIFLDLLPGDNQDEKRNKLEMMKYLTGQTELKSFFDDAVRDNKIKRIGYGYGMKNNSIKDLKNDFEFAITDWIAQSLYCLHSKGLAKDKEEERNYVLSKLSNYLVKKKYLKVLNPVRLRFGSDQRATSYKA
jgi:hypothetical protein